MKMLEFTYAGFYTYFNLGTWDFCLKPALAGDISEKGRLLLGTTPNVFLKVCVYLFIYYLLFNTDYSEQGLGVVQFE